MTAAPSQISSTSARGILFTDLDGTLLDFHTYRPSHRAIATVAELASHGIVTVPVSSKTAAELQHLAGTIPFAEVAVVEGGAGLFTESGGVELIGTGRARLVEILAILQREGWQLRGMSEMPVDQLAELTGLEPAAAIRAMDRLASEPFIFTTELPESVEQLDGRLAELGAETVRGGRFWHLMGRGIDKGRGVDEVLRRLDPDRRLATAAVGDAWNDLPMMERVEFPFILGDAVADHALPTRVRRIQRHGPAGFVVAAGEFVLGINDER